jgi:hypothetical protein
MLEGARHRADRVLSFYSNRPNRDSPPPRTQAGVYLPPGLGGGTLAGGREGGGSKFDEGADTVVLCGARDMIFMGELASISNPVIHRACSGEEF